MSARAIGILLLAAGLSGAFYTGVQLVLTVAYGFAQPAIAYAIGLLLSVAAIAFGALRAAKR